MNQTGLNKKRRGVGSIIAGAFLVLIIMSGYALFQFNNEAQSDYQEILTTMSSEDIIRSQEDVDILYYEPEVDVPNTLKITIQIENNSPNVVILKYGAILLEGEIIEDSVDGPYTKLLDQSGNEYIDINPSGKAFITISRTRPVTEPFERYADYVIHLISENGNVFSVRESDIPAIVINDVMSSVAEVVGNFLPKYTSFEWGSLKNGKLEVNPGWVNNFVIHKNQIDDGYIFSVTGRWYGKDPITISENTIIKFEALEGPAAEWLCYIVHYSPVTMTAESYIGHEIELEAFDLESQTLPDPVTLYFAACQPGGDPSKPNQNFDKNTFKAGDNYQMKLGIFDTNFEYAQTFPLQTLVVEN